MKLATASLSLLLCACQGGAEFQKIWWGQAYLVCIICSPWLQKKFENCWDQPQRPHAFRRPYLSELHIHKAMQWDLNFAALPTHEENCCTESIEENGKSHQKEVQNNIKLDQYEFWNCSRLMLLSGLMVLRMHEGFIIERTLVRRLSHGFWWL